jgi:exosome complex component RRP41
MPKKTEKTLIKKGVRTDNRKPNDLRSIKIDIGILDKADGSAYLEWGNNKVLVGVYGPREIHPRHLALPDKALFRCRYHMAPFSVGERKHPAPSRREIELSKVIGEALEPAILTEFFPRTGIDAFIEILNSDGGTRCAGITATSIALADAGIPLKDLIVACAAGKIDGKIVLDLNEVEDQFGEADVPVAIMPRTDEILLLQMDGRLSPEEFKKTLALAIDGCKQVYTIQKDALMKKYGFTETSDEGKSKVSNERSESD